MQRTRKKGSAMPGGAIYVGRPTMWGNPFQSRRWGHAKSVILHDRWLQGRLGALSLERMDFCPAEIEALYRMRERVLTGLHHIAGHALACWCPLSSKWCHAETLIRMANVHADYEKFAA
ncbi:DUF4326 domain-containing protein [Novosphingobium sp. ST904]|uniref:DUF4326 domain-containing protein n=2 Tax=Novosphingobium sp. ST904 TaxID=1684385 RepID=UPI001A9DB71B|nr:DUF4326 domain-containing protein [Novosphingobium sp. ST904]